MQTDFSNSELARIRDAVPHLDLVAIRALRRAGFEIVPTTPEPVQVRTLRTTIPRPMKTASLADLPAE